MNEWKKNGDTVDSPQIGHQWLGHLLMGGDGRAVEWGRRQTRCQTEAVMTLDKSWKRRIWLDPEDIRFQDCQLYSQIPDKRAPD
jgi:hypothetical protein